MISRLGIILLLLTVCTGCHRVMNGNMQPCKRIRLQIAQGQTNQGGVGAPGAPAPATYSQAYQAQLLQEYQHYDCEDR